MSKPFWTSKTFWACLAAGIVIVLQWAMGEPWIPPVAQGIIGTVVFLLLRFTTDQGITIR